LIQAFIIVFREVIEAGLIIGIVLAATQGTLGRFPYIMGGLGGGLLGSALLALFAGSISSALEGMGQEVFNASILCLAAMMLAWHNVWMARHGRQMSTEMAAFGREVGKGSKTLMALAVVIGIAVLREGSEVVLFLYGIVVSSGASAMNIFLGGLLGVLAGGAISALTYRGLVVIPLKTLFKITALLIAFMAAGMATQAVAFLEQADIVGILSKTAWNTSGMVPDGSIAGKVLHTLLGYTAEPTQLQLLVYAGTLAVIFGLMKVFAPPARPLRQAASTAAAH